MGIRVTWLVFIGIAVAIIAMILLGYWLTRSMPTVCPSCQKSTPGLIGYCPNCLAVFWRYEHNIVTVAVIFYILGILTLFVALVVPQTTGNERLIPFILLSEIVIGTGLFVLSHYEMKRIIAKARMPKSR